MADEQEATNITLQTLNTELNLGASDELLTRLKENQIESLADVRSKGGLADLDGVAESDQPVIRTLEAHAQLSLLAERPADNAKLIDRGFANPIQIADTPRRDFVSAVGDELGAVKAEQIYAKATAQNRLLNNIITDIRARAANGIALSEEEQPIYDAIRSATGDKAVCKDCQSAVSPLAYLADLIAYALKNIVLAPSAASGTGLRGEYYDDLEFRNLVLSRVDQAIDFTWGDDAPAPVLQADTFSVRWSGYLEPEFGEEYTFRTEADDGVRFWVNRKLLIDQWKDQPGAISYTGKLALEAGRKYPVTLEYYDNAGAASVKLRWSSPSRPEETIPTNRLYPGLDLQFLTDRLHQPLGELPVSCEALERKVRQVRIAVEVLRSHLKTLNLGPAEIEKIEAAGAAYCLAAYQGLLTRLGTSFADLRAARTADQSARRTLADRLGIVLTEPRPALQNGGDELDRLFLLPKSDSASKSLDEQNLEVLFGLADTRRDPLSEGAKLGDNHAQIRRWNLDGVQWGINTDHDGRLFVRLSRSQPENHYLVQVYGDAARTQLQASGTRDTATGTVVLQSVNANGLTGVFEIACSQDGDEAIEIAAVPAFLAWRLRYLRDTWLRQDFPLDAYSPDASAAETTKVLPLIDPDLIGPDDFRNPEPNNDKAFELWAKRRAWVDQHLHGFAALEQKTIPLATTFFESGKAWLEDRTRDILYSFNGIFAGNPNLVLRLEGHADSKETTGEDDHEPHPNVGWHIAAGDLRPERLAALYDARPSAAQATASTSDPETARKELSATRAMMVANFFIYYDVADRDRLRPSGYGASRPVAANDSEEGRAKNRRVELIPCTLLETLSGFRGASLTAAHKAALDRLVPMFQANPLMVAYVDGHADPDGGSRNLEISKQRAEAVADYLREQGVAGHQLHPAWFGEMCPKVVPNDTEKAQRANRRVELLLAERAIPDWEKLVTDMGRVDYLGSVETFWKETLESLDTLRADLEQADDSGRRDDARKRITDHLKLTLESFTRLMAVREKSLRWEEDPVSANKVTAEEWGEAFSILTQAQKEFLYRRWRREEAGANVLLGTRTFWFSLQEPMEGTWPVIDFRGSPFIDPESLKLTDLPDPTTGKTAIEIWARRRDELKAIAASLKSKPRTAAGLDEMLKQALGDPLPENLDRLQEDLESGDKNASDQAKIRIEQRLYLSVEQFRRLMAFRGKTRSEKPARKPTDGEWTEIHSLLTTVQKRRERYPVWDTEERQARLVYWRARKAKLPRWRANAEARGAWRQALRERSRAPIVDPDLISEEYIKPVTRPDSVLPGLWTARRDDVKRWLDELRARHTDGLSPDELLQRFAESVHDIIGVSMQDLMTLDSERKEGKSIGRRLDQLDLSYETFTYLLRIHSALDKKEAGAILTSEWDDVDSILVQVRKQREFAAWRQEERSGKLSLCPDHFRFPRSSATDDTPPSLMPLPAWRATDSTRRDWEQTLQGRIDQQEATIAAVNEAVSTAEEETLPLLRDGLIMLDNPSGSSLPEKAKALTDRLLIDMAMGGCGKTTRIAQASETIQSLLWSLRTGLLADPRPELMLIPETFDEEWKWIGSYAAWRAAMFIFLYPENVLLPTLRKHPTPAFRNLVNESRQNYRLTPVQACTVAKVYSDYFEDICKLLIEASCQVKTETSDGRQILILYAFSRGRATNTTYWSACYLSTSEKYPQTFWEPIPGLNNVVGIIGAVPYEYDISENQKQRFICLFAKTSWKGGEKLSILKYDLNTQKWSRDLVELDIPDDGGYKTLTFSATIKQRWGVTEPPVVAIQLPSRSIYLGKLNRDVTDWESTEWKNNALVTINNFSSGGLLAMVGTDTGRTDEFYLVLRNSIGGTSMYRLFGPRDVTGAGGQWKFVGDVSMLPFRGALCWPKTADLLVFYDPQAQGSFTNSLLVKPGAPPGRGQQREDKYTQASGIRDMPYGIARIPPQCGVGTSTLMLAYQGESQCFHMELARSVDKLTAVAPEQSLSPLLTDFPPVIPELSEQAIEERRSKIVKLFNANRNTSRSNWTYIEEAYYFVPVFLALQLQQRGHYAAALDWLRVIYDYSNQLPERRKIYYGLKIEESLQDFGYRGEDWLLDPLNPHAIAETRTNSYTRYTLLSLVGCFLQYADAEFTQDTLDSVSRARILYMSALELLESDELIKRISITENSTIAPMNRHDAAGRSSRKLVDLLDGGNPMSANLYKALLCDPAMSEPHTRMSTVVSGRFLSSLSLARRIDSIKLEGSEASNVKLHSLSEPRVALPSQNSAETVDNRTLSDPARPGDAGGTLNIPPITPGKELALKPLPYLPVTEILIRSWCFCIPPNPALAALRLRTDLNLHKLRKCFNIAGMAREIDSYSAPTDSRSGLPIIGAGGQLILPGITVLRPTPYRYKILIDRARQLVQLASQIEAAMLASLEKRDAEGYNLLKALQDVRLTRAGVRLQDLRVLEAEGQVGLAELQLERAQLQVYHYTSLLAEDISGTERAALVLMWSTVGLQSVAAALYASTKDYGGASGALASAASTTATALSTIASYERRKQEWDFQKTLAFQDVRIGAQQVKIAEDRVRIVGQERAIADMQAVHAEAVVDLLSRKFTNVDLYDWMSDILARVYSFFLQQATAVAKLAENQLGFERQETPPALIQANYWEAPGNGMNDNTDGRTPDRRGLSGSARLMQDIYQLDQYAFETDKRRLQLTKTISLAQLAPVEFQRFRQTGVMVFRTPMKMFDRDFPGQYLRLIRRVRTSVVALISPIQGIHATLTASGISQVVIGGAVFQSVVVRREPDLVALSSSRDATGIFELEPQSDMLFPFEAMGVDTTWEFRMPKPANLFDYDGIADVLITMEFTALSSSDYRQQVLEDLGRTFSADRAFSFRQQFADAWFVLNNPDLAEESTEMVVRFNTASEDFPPNVDALRIQHVVLYFARAKGRNFEVPVRSFRFTDDEGTGSAGGAATSFDGVISTRRGNAGSWLSMQGKKPFGKWELTLPNTEEMRNRFRNEEIEDILFVLTYSGQTPEWPT